MSTSRTAFAAACLAAFVLLAGGRANAQALVVNHTGRLLGANDAPVDDSGVEMTFRIFKTLNPPGSRTQAFKWRDDGTLETRATASCNGCHR